MTVQGKTVLVTGGTSGIGEAIARAYAAEGADVVITGRSEERGRQIVDSLTKDGAQRALHRRRPRELRRRPAPGQRGRPRRRARQQRRRGRHRTHARDRQRSVRLDVCAERQGAVLPHRGVRAPHGSQRRRRDRQRLDDGRQLRDPGDGAVRLEQRQRSSCSPRRGRPNTDPRVSASTPSRQARRGRPVPRGWARDWTSSRARFLSGVPPARMRSPTPCCSSAPTRPPTSTAPW